MLITSKRDVRKLVWGGFVMQSFLKLFYCCIILIALSACSLMPSEKNIPVEKEKPQQTQSSQQTSGELEKQPETITHLPTASEYNQTLPAQIQQQLVQFKQLVSQQKESEARQLLLQLGQAHPDYPQIDLNLALLELKNNNTDAALAAVSAALKKQPDYAPNYNLQGVIYRRVGQFSEAKNAYLKALELDPNYANAHLNLGILADSYLHEWPLALVSFERFLALVGEHKKVADWVLELKRRMPATEELTQ